MSGLQQTTRSTTSTHAPQESRTPDAQDTLGNAALQEQLCSADTGDDGLLCSLEDPVCAEETPEDQVCDPCAAEAEAQRAFEARDFSLVDHIPSTGLGKFDAAWDPSSGQLQITVKIHFGFVAADDTPGLFDLISQMASGVDVSQFFWSDAEKTTFAGDFVSNVRAAWSGQHVMNANRPCWEHYRAVPVFEVVQTDAAAGAHFDVTVHKVSDAERPFVYRSAMNNENLSDPANQPTGDLWETDNDTNANFRSGRVAQDERRRIDAAITAAGAGDVRFGRDSDVLAPSETGKLDRLAAALNQVYPSAPRIPLDIFGWASAEGAAAHNDDLSERRAEAVERYLTGKGVPQPMTSVGGGAIGAPNDAANRSAEVSTDTAFEGTYTGNEYAVGPHEFSHMLGLTDEYRATEGGLLAGARTRYQALMTSAGVEQPRWGEDTSSIVSAGTDVLPRHYVTVWEALGRMTAPDLTQSQWTLR